MPLELSDFVNVDELQASLLELEREFHIPNGVLFGLHTEDDWSFVIKGHAILEGAISQLLAARLDPRLEPIFAFMELGRDGTGKLEFAKALGLITSDERRFVRMLSRVRNIVAHDMRHLSFTWDNYISTLDRQQQKTFFEAVSIGIKPAQFTEWHDYVRTDPRRALTVCIALIVIKVSAFKSLTATKEIVTRLLEKARAHQLDKESVDQLTELARKMTDDVAKFKKPPSST